MLCGQRNVELYCFELSENYYNMTALVAEAVMLTETDNILSHMEMQSEFKVNRCCRCIRRLTKGGFGNEY